MDYYIDYNLLYNKELLEKLELDICCIICKGILNEPKMCLNCENNFCSACIETLCNRINQNSNIKICPFRCNNKKFVKNNVLKNILSKICYFYCEFGCKEIIPYKEINSHINKCKNRNKKLESEQLMNKYCKIVNKNSILNYQIKKEKENINELIEIYSDYINLNAEKVKNKELLNEYNFFLKYNTNPLTKEELNEEFNFDYKLIEGSKGKNKHRKKYKNKIISVNDYYDNKLKKLKEKYIK
jgi:hypothetical protein